MNDAHTPQSAGILNHRARAALSGQLIGIAGDISDALADLLRSDCAIDPDVRQLMAAALDRGRAGERVVEHNENGVPLPRLAISGLGDWGTLCDAIKVRRGWLDAAALFEQLRSEGVSRDNAKRDAAGSIGKSVATIEKNALPYKKRLDTLLLDQANDLCRAVQALGFQPSDPDYFDVAASLFVEADAEAETGLNMHLVPRI